MNTIIPHRHTSLHFLISGKKGPHGVSFFFSSSYFIFFLFSEAYKMPHQKRVKIIITTLKKEEVLSTNE